MSEWITVNGARIERKFFEENVAEAKRYVWTRTVWGKPGEHCHCMICTAAISQEEPYYAYRSNSLCEYCFHTFVATDRTGADTR